MVVDFPAQYLSLYIDRSLSVSTIPYSTNAITVFLQTLGTRFPLMSTANHQHTRNNTSVSTLLFHGHFPPQRPCHRSGAFHKQLMHIVLCVYVEWYIFISSNSKISWPWKVLTFFMRIYYYMSNNIHCIYLNVNNYSFITPVNPYH